MTDTTPTPPPKRNPDDPNTFHEYLWIPDALAHARHLQYRTGTTRRPRSSDVTDLVDTIRLLGEAVTALQGEILAHAPRCWGTKKEDQSVNGWSSVNAEQYDRTVGADLWTLVDTAGDNPGWYIHGWLGEVFGWLGEVFTPQYMGGTPDVATVAANQFINSWYLSVLHEPKNRGLGAQDHTYGYWKSVYHTDWFYAWQGYRFHLQRKSGTTSRDVRSWMLCVQTPEDRRAGDRYSSLCSFTGSVGTVKEEARTKIVEYLIELGHTVKTLDAPGGRGEC